MKYTLEGVAKSEWIGPDGRIQARIFTETEKLLDDEETFVFGSATSEDVPFDLGVYKYDFSCRIPFNIPYSLNEKNGFIRYKIKASLLANWNHDAQEEIPFKISQNVDLNIYPSLKNPFSVEETHIPYSFCCNSKPLMIAVSLPRRGFISDETIPIQVTLDNKSLFVYSKTKIFLQRTIVFIAENNSKEDHKELVSINCGGVRQQQKTVYDRVLRVPQNLLPSTDKLCSVLKVVYRIVVEVTSESNTEGVLHVPILIGDIALRGRNPPAAIRPTAPQIALPGRTTSTPTAPVEISEEVDLGKDKSFFLKDFLIGNFISAPPFEEDLRKEIHNKK